MNNRRKSFEQLARRLNRAARNAMKDRRVEWYAIFVMAGREMQVHRALKSWGRVTSFLPLRRKWQQVNRYSKEQVGIARPAIAGCLIVGVEDATTLFEIRRDFDSVYGVLGIAGEAAKLDREKVEEFVSSNRFACDGQKREFNIGDRVTCLEGLLSNHELKIDTIHQGEAHFTVQLLGIPMLVSQPLDNLEHAA
ncbi:MAG: hypothetical protein JJ979_16950 [Roseibium sp.]|nr:hypothetical protein [Roseibium sp.]